MKKRIFCFVLTCILILGFAVPSALAASSGDYRHWDSAGHGWNGSGIANGCLVLAINKLLIENEIQPSSYTPDMMYRYLKQKVGFNSANGLLAGWPQAVAATSPSLHYDGYVSLSGKSASEKKQIIMNYMKSGSRLLIQVRDGSNQHWVYGYNSVSVSKGEPWCMDSINSSNDTWRVENNVHAISYYDNYANLNMVHIYHMSGANPDRTYTIKYNANGGTGTMKDTTVTFGTTTKTSTSTFQRSGYYVTGWNGYRQSDDKWAYSNGSTIAFYKKDEQPAGYSLYLYGNGCSVAKTSPYRDDVIVFYAVWDHSRFTIQYDANGGTGEMESTTITNGTTTPTSVCTFQRPGYVMKGWNGYRYSDNKWAYSNGSKIDFYTENEQPEGYSLYLYGNGCSVAKTSPYHNDIIVFYAIWEKTATPPIISEQPRSIYTVGQVARLLPFTVTCKESGLSFQWQVSTDSGKTWSDLVGETEATYEASPDDTHSGWLFRCKVTDQALNCTVSSPVVLAIGNYLRLPSGTEVIAEQSFCNTNAYTIDIPENVDTIEAEAFANSETLYVLRFNGSPSNIADNILAGSTNARILAPSNSTAIEWAIAHGITYEIRN